MDCLFCKIGSGEVSSEIIYEDDSVKAFKDIKPSAPVHYLIIPKKHITSVVDLKESDSALMMQLILTAQRLAGEAGLLGYRLVFNVGREGGQVIDHLHLHLLGGWNDDNSLFGVRHPRLDK